MTRRFRLRPAIWVGVAVFALVAGIGVAGEWDEISGAAEPAATPGTTGVPGAATSGATAESEPAASTTSSVTPTALPTAPTAPSAAPADGTALALLETLPVKGRAPKTGYDRDVVFGTAWKDVDRNGCDTRNDILRRDLTGVVIKANTQGCVALAGSLTSPYTGEKISFVRGVGTSTKVQIDHVVALMDAWQSGAQKLTQTRREQLANDPLNLLAVDGRSNAQKGAGNAATWLPANKGYRCEYVARQITVKAKYELWVTSAERVAMARILSTCADQPAATAGTITLMPNAVGPVPSATKAPSSTPSKTPAEKKPTPSPTKSSAHKETALPVVHPGAFCTPEGARGVTVKGTAMRCTLKGGDSRARWRSAG
ncbi:DUF1524 domain-containing protein [Microbacterium sp. KR10-403]|uniref:HNH endonuclease family protein n=1 Tax=Microbacterium sp. KR10-403 TaxID=3158581 RepID=UPI0032E3F21E